MLSLNGALTMFLLAVLANVSYCAAHLAELLVQLSEYREPWRRGRRILWLLGTAFALALAHFSTRGMFCTDCISPRP